MEWLTILAPWATAGFGAGGGFLMVKWFVEWVSGRVDKRRDDLDAGTARLIDALEKRVNALQEREEERERRLAEIEEELRECKRRDSEKDAELMRLKALMQGYGDARNVAQIEIAAAKRDAR